MWPRMNILRSNWWPVVTYFTMVAWLLTINRQLFGDPVMPIDYYYNDILIQFDGLVHYATALALASTGTLVLGRHRTLQIMLALIVLWEVFEIIVLPVTGTPFDHRYVGDTFDDIAMGIAGILMGVYFGGDEPLNSAEAIEEAA